MILYDNVCTPCVRKQQWRDLRRFAIRNRLTVNRVDLSKQPEKEPHIDGVKIPFIVHEGKVISLNGNFEELL